VAGRSGRLDGRVDAALFAGALILSIVALALSEPRADRIAGSMRRTVLSPLVSLQQRAERARRALSEHDSVTRFVDSVSLQALDAARLAEENAHLRSLLALGRRLQWRYVAADAFHSPPLGEEHTLVLNAGTDAGIQEFSAVIAPDGVVGYVRQADRTTSVAIVWPHPDFRVSVMSNDSAAFGIVGAHLGGSGGRFMLELRGVPFRAPLDSGEMIVSSGFGGTFPRGVPVGTVLRELSTASDWERSYLILPAVRPVDVGTVIVLIAPLGRADIGGAWRVSGDTTTRRPPP
jgi:rod shape-determining protein MreC